ncbi:hypothetical protein HPB50_021190 [Hyalomma asiaticum]|uniref:Uncharacterized protein n=1 Tax=Hyalomma asiaticum TaxID=266040 RepID=A0ACB7RWS8_HYAAI|nr:hypothetical protein HPB50_021190 [Hyalomma asiaticum]
MSFEHVTVAFVLMATLTTGRKPEEWGIRGIHIANVCHLRPAPNELFGSLDASFRVMFKVYVTLYGEDDDGFANIWKYGDLLTNAESAQYMTSRRS